MLSLAKSKILSNAVEQKGRVPLPGSGNTAIVTSPFFKKLAMRLSYDLAPPAKRSVLLVGSRDAVAASSSSLSLAQALAAESQNPVLLIDACPEDPRIARALACEGTAGFTDVLADSISADDAILTTSADNLAFLPSGRASFGIVEPEQVRALFAAFLANYEILVIFGGAALRDAGVIVLAPAAGCVLLVALENETRSADLQAATRALGTYKASRVGLVIAEQESRRRSREGNWPE